MGGERCTRRVGAGFELLPPRFLLSSDSWVSTQSQGAAWVLLLRAGVQQGLGETPGCDHRRLSLPAAGGVFRHFRSPWDAYNALQKRWCQRTSAVPRLRRTRQAGT